MKNKPVGKKQNSLKMFFFFLRKVLGRLFEGGDHLKHCSLKGRAIFFYYFPIKSKKDRHQKKLNMGFLVLQIWFLDDFSITRGGLEPSAIDGLSRLNFPTSSTGDVTSQIAENDWERG